MTADVTFLASARAAKRGRARREEPCAAALLHDLRDMLFVIEGAAMTVAPPVGAPALRRIADAARQASERARALAALIDAPAPGAAFDVHARLRALRVALEASLPPGGTLRLRPAAGLWHAQGDAACFDEAVLALVRRAGESMRRQGIAASVAIMTSNRPSARPNGRVRISVVSDVAWSPEGTPRDLAMRAISDAVSRRGGRMVRAALRGGRVAAHVEFPRACRLPPAPAPVEASGAAPVVRLRPRMP